MKGCVIQFAKAPVAGRVKTRLQPTLNIEQSAQLHRQLVLHCHAQLASWCEQGNAAQVLAITPEPHPFWREFPNTLLWSQPEGDLGQRMRAAVTWGLTWVDWVILVGSDCPALDEDYMQQAAQALAAGAPLVVGPANDGGYVLIGMSRLQPLFDGVDWGGDRVLAQTLRHASAVGVSPMLLPTLPDIDRPEDLHRLAKWSHLAGWARFNQI